MRHVFPLRGVLVVAFAAAAVLASPVMAAAQVEAGGSFQVLHDRQVTLPSGWQVSLAGTSRTDGSLPAT